MRWGMKELLNNIWNKLRQDSPGRPPRLMVGFDGYIDDLVHPVRQIGDSKDVQFFESMEEFGNFIASRANQSCSIELCSVVKKIGGNAPIFGKAAASLGISTTCIGAFGYPDVHELFREPIPNLEFISVANPGCCTALEFKDGKVMLADNQGIHDLNYRTLQERLKKDQLLEIVEASDVIALMNWSEVLGCIGIWKGMIHDILPRVENMEEKLIFLDLSDCSGRSQKDFEELIRLIRGLSGFCRVLLSLNHNEFEQLTRQLEGSGTVRERMKLIQEACGLWALVIHEHEGAQVLENDQVSVLENRYNPRPKILTGGGDNFNAGLVYGLMMGMDLKEAVLVGNAVSGYYVTKAKSPDRVQLMEFVDRWRRDQNPEEVVEPWHRNPETEEKQGA